MPLSLDECRKLIWARGCPFCGSDEESKDHSFQSVFNENGGHIKGVVSKILIKLTCKAKYETATYNPEDLEEEFNLLSQLENWFSPKPISERAEDYARKSMDD